MAEAARLTVKIDTNADQAAKDIKQFGNSLDSVKKIAFAAVAAKITEGFIDISKASIDAASDAEETANKFNVVFSSVIEGASAAAKELNESYGLSSRASQQLLSDTGDLLTGFGFSQDAALDLSTQVAKLGVDLASFTNFSGGAEGAADALTKALLGERESVKALGISILEADVQAKVLELSQRGLTFETERQAKAYATLELATEQSANALGDFERSSDSLANQQRITQAAIEDLQADLGRLFLPAVNAVTQAVGGLAKLIIAVPDPLKAAGVAAAGAAAGILTLSRALIAAGGKAEAFGLKLQAALGPIAAGVAAVTAIGFALADAFAARKADLVAGLSEEVSGLVDNLNLAEEAASELKLRLAEFEVLAASGGVGKALAQNLVFNLDKASELLGVSKDEARDLLLATDGVSEGARIWLGIQQQVSGVLDGINEREQRILDSQNASLEAARTLIAERQAEEERLRKLEEERAAAELASRNAAIAASQRLFQLEEAGVIGRRERLEQAVSLYTAASDAVRKNFVEGNSALSGASAQIREYEGFIAALNEELAKLDENQGEVNDGLNETGEETGAALTVLGDGFVFLEQSSSLANLGVQGLTGNLAAFGELIEAEAEPANKKLKESLKGIEEQAKKTGKALKTATKATQTLTQEEAMAIGIEQTRQQNILAIADAAGKLSEETKKATATIVDFGVQSLSAIDGLLNTLSAGTIATIDAEIEAAKKAGKNVEELEKKKREEIRKSAETRKIFAIAEAGINTALGVTAALAQANPILATSIGVLGAIEVATIAATPIPAAQFGGEFTVPPGNQQDGGIVRVNSDERVSVEPARGNGNKTMIIRIGERDFRGYFEEETDRAINSGRVTARRRGFVRA